MQTSISSSKSQGIHTKLVGNIGKSILSNYHFTKKTLFVVEASSYQIEYSKYYKTNFAAILNVSVDHLERHTAISKLRQK